jgi:hypothetical protein
MPEVPVEGDDRLYEAVIAAICILCFVAVVSLVLAFQ